MKKKTLLVALLVVPMSAAFAWQSGRTIGGSMATGGSVDESRLSTQGVGIRQGGSQPVLGTQAVTGYTNDGTTFSTQNTGYATTGSTGMQSYTNDATPLGTQSSSVTPGSTGAQSYKR